VKTIVIFCPYVAADKYPFNDPYRWDSYQDLLLAIRARGAAAYFAADNATYRGQGVFATAYTTDRKCQVAEFEVARDVKAGLVFEKGAYQGQGGFAADDVRVVNPRLMREITSSKTETYRHFGKFQPRSVVCHSRAEVERAMEEVPGELIVVKEPKGNGGKLVYIGTREKVKAELPGRYPLMVQEFVDTSAGIPGLVEGIHDFRVRIAGGTIVGGELRVPAPGEYRANIAQGGTTRFLLADKVPAAVKELAAKIDSYFADDPRYYSIDFAHTTQGWKLIELNDQPGLSPAADGPEARDAIEQLADYLIKVCP
jgi:glutathione synthase/RimK-type ligase-like ATP-grasp enzyme